MLYIRPRLLGLAFVILYLTGCASNAPDPQIETARDELRSFMYGEGDDDLIIDLATSRAWTSEWSSDIEDCSNSDFSCVRVIGRVDLVFPRNCDAFDGGRNIDVITPIGNLYFVGQIPHFSIPSGVYYTSRYPNIAIFVYRTDFGIIRIEPRQTSTDDFPNSISKPYNILVLGNPRMFACDAQDAPED